MTNKFQTRLQKAILTIHLYRHLAIIKVPEPFIGVLTVYESMLVLLGPKFTLYTQCLLPI